MTWSTIVPTQYRFEYENWRFRSEAVINEKDFLETLQDNAKQILWKAAKAANAELTLVKNWSFCT